jgi:hypothetical protein
VTEILLLAVIWGDAVFDDIVAPAMRTGDDFGNHILTLTRHFHHSSLAHYPQGDLQRAVEEIAWA